MKKKIYIWCSDIDRLSGEGILANKFVIDLKKYNPQFNLIVKSISKKKIIFLRKIFGKISDRFIIPMYGVITLWVLYLFKQNKKICFVNYLPLWNFLIFICLPPKTILGPITGGGKFLKGSFYNFLIRKILFNFFYNISINFINLRYEKILFSTDLLRDKFKSFDKVYSNYVLKDFKYRNLKKKRINDLVVYLRDHQNKRTDIILKLIKELSVKYRIITVGKIVNYKKIKCIKKISRKKLHVLLQKTKFSFLSPENKYSFFALDCLSNGVHVFYNKDDIPLKQMKVNMTPLNYNNPKNFLKIIKRKLDKSWSKPKKIKLYKEENFSSYFKI